MHVLMTADTVGGVWSYTTELVSGLLRRGHRVTLISFGKLPCTQQIKWMEQLGAIDYRPTPYALEWMQDSQEDIRASMKYVSEVIAESKPDLLHFNQYAYGAIETSLPKIVVAHSDVVSWWVAVHNQEPPDSPWMAWYRETVEKGLEGADTVVAPSRWMLDAVRQYYSFGTRGEVIYNGRDPSLFDPNAEKENRVVSVGRVWDQAKQVSLLAEKPQAVPVCIVGSARHPDDLIGGTASVPAAQNLQLLGQQSEAQVRSVLASAGIYAATACYEPFGLAAVEAALSRCALIANDIPVFHELWGDAAFYFRTNDAQSLSDVIATLSNDSCLRQQYGNRAYELAIQRFSIEHALDRYEQLYGALVPQEAAA